MSETQLQVFHPGDGQPGAPQHPAGVINTTLGEWGKKLPIGVPDPATGRLVKSFSTKSWKTADEKALSKIKKPSMTMAEYASSVIASMCTEVGGIVLNHDTKLDDRIALLRNMYMGDMFYVYCWLRHEAMGDKLKLTFGCPTCQKRLPFVGSLETVTVRAVEELSPLRWTYRLHNPIRIRGNKDVTSFQMSAPKWQTSFDAAAGGGEGAAKAAAIRGAVIGVNDETDMIILAHQEIDEISKRDLEELSEEIDERFMGPSMAIEGSCGPAVCPMGGGYDFRVPIKWDYDSFFSGSSR